jgi:hypothetical protein
MRSAPWFRTVAATLTIWLGLVMAGPTLVHACPMHDAVVIASSESPHANGPSDEHAHGDHGVAAPSEGDDHGAECCTCLGDCGAPTIAWTGLASFAVPSRPLAAPRREAAPDDARLPGAPDHLIPFANGPPRLA